MDTLHAEPEAASATERAILADVRARFEATENPRLRQLILGLMIIFTPSCGSRRSRGRNGSTS